MPDDVYAVTPDDGEKRATLRLAIVKAARQSGKTVVVRGYGERLLVALSTPERERARRGRRPQADASAGP